MDDPVLLRCSAEPQVDQRQARDVPPAQPGFTAQTGSQCAPDKTGRTGDDDVHGSRQAALTTRCSITPNGPSRPSSISGLHADPVAELHEPGLDLAEVDLLDHAPLGDAGRARGARLVGNRSRADDAARRQAPRARRVGDQLPEMEIHLAAVRFAESLAVPFDMQFHLHPAVAPAVAEFVGRDRHRSKGGRRLGLQEAEAGLHLVRPECAQAPVVDLHDQTDAPQCRLGRRAHRHRAADHAELAFEVDAVGFARHRHLIKRAEEVVTRTLVHHRDGVEVRNRRCIESLLHQVAVVQEGRGIEPLRAARQRRHAALRIEREGVRHPSGIEGVVEFGKRTHDVVPARHRVDQGRC